MSGSLFIDSAEVVPLPLQARLLARRLGPHGALDGGQLPHEGLAPLHRLVLLQVGQCVALLRLEVPVGLVGNLVDGLRVEGPPGVLQVMLSLRSRAFEFISICTGLSGKKRINIPVSCIHYCISTKFFFIIHGPWIPR